MAELPDDDALVALVERMADGDRDAAGALFDAVGPWVHGALLRMLGDADAAELLTRRTVVEMWRAAPLWDRHVGRPLLWSLALARNLGVQWLDEQRRAHAEVGTPASDRPAPGPGQVGRALASLDDETRARLEGGWYQDVDAPETPLDPALRRWATVLAG